MAKIKCINARQIFDSHGNPTVEVDVTLNDGTFARAAAPSSASTGIYAALKLTDGGSDYLGKVASKAVDNINTIIGPALVGMDPIEQAVIDNIMVQQLDGTRNEWGWCKQKLGANAILAVSLAVCKAGAAVYKIPLYKRFANLAVNSKIVLSVPAFNVTNRGTLAGNKLAMRHIANLAGNSKLVLPVPAFNVVNGGTLAGNKLAMRKFTILPVGASSFKEAVKMSAEVYHHLKDVIKKKYGQGSTNVGEASGFFQENEEGLELLKIATKTADDTDKDVIKKKYGQGSINAGEAGGFIKENEEVLELLKMAIKNAEYTAQVVIGMGVAASEFYGQDKTYDMNFKEENNDGSQKIPGDALGNVYESLVGDYAIGSFEDPFGQDDLEHYARMTDKIGEHVQIVGGELWGTNLMRAIDEKTCNALLLKVDQIGSVTESIEAVKMSKVAGWGVMASCGSLGQQRSIANRLSSIFSCFRECTTFRSGETEDPFIADLSVGLATGQIKTAAPCGSKWLAKYNRLLQIEEELGAEAVYAGEDFRMPVEPY